MISTHFRSRCHRRQWVLLLRGRCDAGWQIYGGRTGVSTSQKNCLRNLNTLRRRRHQRVLL